LSPNVEELQGSLLDAGYRGEEIGARESVCVWQIQERKTNG
jgi:hypothetical protein